MAQTHINNGHKTGPADIHVITEPDVVKIFFDPLRRRIVQTMVHTPRTVGQIAEELGLDFRKLYYHVKLLEKHGLIQLVERQLISGAVEEKYYQVSAYRFVIAPALLTFLPTDAADELEAFYTLSDDLCTALTTLTPQIDLQRRMGGLSEEQAAAFQQRLQALLDEFGELCDTTEAPSDDYGLFTGFYRLDGHS